jgi:alcohol dehydrogenase class IV
LVLSTPGQVHQAQSLAPILGEKLAGFFSGAAMHTPVAVTEQAMEVVMEKRVDCLVALGGGSTIGLGKAIALRTGLPQIAIPTTYAGSEMTPILGETKDGAKVTQITQEVLPEVAIYDVEMTLTFPAALSVTSGINAIAHAVEALYARDRNPVICLMAVEGIKALTGALPKIVMDPIDRSSRSEAQYGAWLCGICLGSVGMALHHKLCHTLGGSYNLPHAETHTIVLPHALAYNAPAIPDVIELLARTLNTEDPALALYELAGNTGAPQALRDLGMKESDIDDAVRRAMSNPYWNPRALESDQLREALRRAWAGQPPATE